MKESKSLRHINGSIVFNLPTKTHQSALRIVQRTSYDKFLHSYGHLPAKPMLSAWMKHLFVTSSASKELTRMKAFIVGEITKTKEEYNITEPLDGALHLDVVFRFPYLKGHKSKDRDQGMIRKTTKPDVDNYVKIVMDSMETAGIIENDSRFYSIYLSKYYDSKPGIYWQIKVEE